MQVREPINYPKENRSRNGSTCVCRGLDPPGTKMEKPRNHSDHNELYNGVLYVIHKVALVNYVMPG